MVTETAWINIKPKTEEDDKFFRLLLKRMGYEYFVKNEKGTYVSPCYPYKSYGDVYTNVGYTGTTHHYYDIPQFINIDNKSINIDTDALVKATAKKIIKSIERDLCASD